MSTIFKQPNESRMTGVLKDKDNLKTSGTHIHGDFNDFKVTLKQPIFF